MRANMTAASGKGLGRFLNGIERWGNRLPDPLILFIFLAALVPFASAVASWSGWTEVHPRDQSVVAPMNLLTKDGLQRMLTEAVKVFTEFPALGVVLVAMLGIGLAERTGFIAACMKGFATIVPRRLVGVSVVFGGVMSSIAVDAGYVVYIPLGGLLFAATGRHPLAGICAAFAGVSGGFSANLLVTSLDPLLAGFTDQAAKVIDPTYEVTALGNYYFMFVSTFVISGIGWWVTEKVVEPRLGTWSGEAQAAEPLSPQESRGLKLAALGMVVALLVCAALVIPANGILRGPEGSWDPFMKALIPLLTFVFASAGVTYGWAVRSLRSGEDLAKMLGDTIAAMGPYIVLVFFAAQFVAWFNWSNLGTLIAVSGANFLRSMDPGPLPLLLSIVLLSAAVDLLIGSASAKWAVMAAVIVPMMMSLGYTPESAQAAYRIGDSCTNIITPLMPYFPMILTFGRKYVPDLQMGTLISHMLPYSLSFLIGWCLLLVIWYFAGWPLGPGAGMLLPAQP